MAFVSTLPILFSFSQWTLSALLAFIRSIRKSRREVVDEQCRRGVVSLIVEAIAKLRSRSCIIDGEAVACGEDGIASFDRIRYRHNDDGVFLYAFDLIELHGDDLRRNPLIVRKTTLGSVLARAAPGLRLNEHLEADGPDVFHHACKLGLEGIVSKRKDSRYKSGRSPDWIKSKNPDAPAVKRLAEEEWGRWSAAKPRRSSGE